MLSSPGRGLPFRICRGGDKPRTPRRSGRGLCGALNLTDGQAVAGGLLGLFGVFMEGIGFFAVCRLMADAAPGYARAYCIGILGYIWLAPVGTHMNMGLLDMAYRYLYEADPKTAAVAAGKLFYGIKARESHISQRECSGMRAPKQEH